MPKALKGYGRCVLKNRFTLAGYILLILSFTLYYLRSWFIDTLSLPGTLLYLAFLLLVSTAFGFQTFNTYIRTVKHIQRFGVLDRGYEDKFSFYCDKAGIRAAIEEFPVDRI